MRPDRTAVVWRIRAVDSHAAGNALLLKAGFMVEFAKESPSMKGLRWAVLIFLAFLPLSARARQSDAAKSQNPQNNAPLNDTQKLGQRVFQQRCGICHEQARPGFQTYGPVLYKDLVNGSEDAIKEMIRTGSTKMPGFKLGLQPSEIDAIVEYLKTVPKPPKNTGPAPGGSMGQVD
jgi:mono/diheme cytochrome c family protein